jgi:hypothetical protein
VGKALNACRNFARNRKVRLLRDPGADGRILKWSSGKLNAKV